MKSPLASRGVTALGFATAEESFLIDHFGSFSEKCRFHALVTTKSRPQRHAKKQGVLTTPCLRLLKILSVLALDLSC
jgi:hypothetical protein